MKHLRLLRGVLPRRRTFNARRLLPVIVLTGALAAGAVILVPTSSKGSTQDHNRLSRVGRGEQPWATATVFG